MNIEYNHFEQNVIFFLKRVFKDSATVMKTDEKLLVVSRKDGKESILSVKYLKEILSILNSKEITEETKLHDSKNCEILVELITAGRGLFFPIGMFKTRKLDTENKISYILDQPSNHYFAYLMSKLANTEDLELLVRDYHIDDVLEQAEKDNKFMDLLVSLTPRFMTLQIISDNERTQDSFESLLNSFLFQLAYNLNKSFLPIKSLNKNKKNSINNLRRNSLDNINPPQRVYISDLTNHYQMAVSAGIPCQQFLSYFHIAEHFFESIYMDDLISFVKNYLTTPSFSHKNVSEVKSLVKTIAKKLSIQKEELIIEERVALTLTLKKYVNLQGLKSRLTEIDPNLIDYYKNNEVFFSKGNKIDFESNDTEKIYADLASRIYDTRNSIVHSKETLKPRFIPFKHDTALLKELPLIRTIAEEIIVNTSKEL